MKRLLLSLVLLLGLALPSFADTLLITTVGEGVSQPDQLDPTIMAYAEAMTDAQKHLGIWKRIFAITKDYDLISVEETYFTKSNSHGHVEVHVKIGWRMR